ncbi:MAG: hypothetical protein HFJ08_03125 [Lachnospiraceae bacterium]|jgi:hypothetical protein|nr:hypothetical protein [Lachnospiraceae bacterium]MCI9398570.1 hypothetical protein [Lachnospiraceae bacterium]MCX4376299.1 hypothetical protein [Lachnospiraceae bacterium]
MYKEDTFPYFVKYNPSEALEGTDVVNITNAGVATATPAFVKQHSQKNILRQTLRYLVWIILVTNNYRNTLRYIEN